MERKLVILTEGRSTVMAAKTAVSVIRYCTESVVAVLDSTVSERTTQELFGVGGDIPVVGSLVDAPEANTLVIGIATAGGKLPPEMRAYVLEAIRKGMNVESGLHTFLCDDEEFSREAAASGSVLRDIRKNNEKDVAVRRNIREDCLRIHSVGHDCSIGKMVSTIELTRALKAMGEDAKFVATGQTGILIEGDGCPVDCVVSDFVNGAAEKLVLANQHHDILIVEGQGSLAHPSFSAVTLGLLHGVIPQGLIFCYEAGRTAVKGLEHVAIPPMRAIMDLYLASANIMRPCRFIGIGMNSRNLTDEEYTEEKARVAAEFGLPVCDPIREGAEPLAEAVLRLRDELELKS